MTTMNSNEREEPNTPDSKDEFARVQDVLKAVSEFCDTTQPFVGERFKKQLRNTIRAVPRASVAAVQSTTPSDAAMRAAEELKSLGLLWNAEAAVELGGEPFDENEQIERVAAIITRNLAATPSPETAVGGEAHRCDTPEEFPDAYNQAAGGEAQEIAEQIAAPTVGKVKAEVYHEIVSGIKTAISNTYEDAAVIAETCTQDNAARDEPFRIAQTIRERAGLAARPTTCMHCDGPITEGPLAGTWVHTKTALTTCRKPGAAKADGIFNAEPAPVIAAGDETESE